MTIFEAVKKLCDERKMSINELEKALGYSQNTLYRLKTQNPGADKLIALADYFNVKTDYLLGRENKYWEPIEKENNDVALETKRMINGLESNADLKFDGKPMSTEEKDKLAMALKIVLEISKQEATRKLSL